MKEAIVINYLGDQGTTAAVKKLIVMILLIKVLIRAKMILFRL